METRLYLTVIIPDDEGKGIARVNVSQWDDDDLVYNSRSYDGVAFATQLQPEHSVYPWAMAVLRDASDRAISAMMEKFARGEVLLMHEAKLH